MTPSKNAIDLIKKFEGCRLEAYLCPAGKWTIGYGTTGPGIQEGLKISQSMAEALLVGTVKEIGISLSDLLGRQGLLINPSGLSQNQMDALTSLIYNVGMGAFKRSAMFGFIKSRLYKEAAREFDNWHYVSGQPSEGLKKRREEEKALFLLQVGS